MIVRRVVTGRKGGKSVVVSDSAAPRTHDFVHLPGMSLSLVWATPAAASLAGAERDPVNAATSLLPPPGESRLLIVAFPPDSIYASPGFDGAAASSENAAHCPDISAAMEPDCPGMHTTETVDYAIVLQGPVWLELDDGQQVELRDHDVVIQNGTRHAWRNKGAAPATVAFTMIGASQR
jgi:uncharacterized cupin superfamily protein